MNVVRLFAGIAISALVMCSASNAADIEIAPRSSGQPSARTDIPVQQNQPNCTRWTDECVTCSRGTGANGPMCSNIGPACQPKTIRCLSDDLPQEQPRK